MPSGGYRPGSGRKKGSKSKTTAAIERAQIRQLLVTGIKAKAKIYQDFLVKISKSESLTMPEKQLMVKLSAELAAEVREDTQIEGYDPENAKSREYLERLLADPGTDQETKIRIAGILLPYQYPRLSEGIGKKDEKMERAKVAGSGKFAAGKPPVLKVVGK